MSLRWLRDELSVSMYISIVLIMQSIGHFIHIRRKKGREKEKRERERRRGEAGKHRHTVWYCNPLKAKL